MSDEMATNWAKRERPGCVTAYAILLWVGAALGLFAGLCGLSSMMSFAGGGLGGFEFIIIGMLLVLLAINVVTGIGLWQMKKWGWAMVIVLHGLSVLLGLLSMALTLFTLVTAGGEYVVAEPTILCGNLGSLAISGFILYWFITNRELFNGGMAVKTVVGPDGEIAPQPVEKKTSDATMILAVSGGLVLVFVLICVVVFVMLVMLGPQIGNVFSQITFSLENPAAGVMPWLW